MEIWIRNEHNRPSVIIDRAYSHLTVLAMPEIMGDIEKH